MKSKDNLYILRTYLRGGNTFIKFGYSGNMEKRLRQYTDHNPGMELIGTFYREDAKLFEKDFHKQNKSKIRNEWYEESLLPEILSAIFEEPQKVTPETNAKRNLELLKSIEPFV